MQEADKTPVVAESATPAPAPVKLEETQTPAPAPVVLSEAEVDEALNKTRLPPIVRKAIKATQYENADKLTEAIKAATDELKEALGSGRPVAQPATQEAAPVPLEELNKRKDAVNKKYFGG